MGLSRLLVCAALLAAFSSGSAAEPINLYEWVAPAPIVVLADGLGDNGRYSEVRVREALRGDAGAGAVLRIDVRRANTERSEHAGDEALRLDQGSPYLLLLQRAPPRKKNAAPVFRLVRDVRGARPLPPEGAAAFLEALRRFIETQELRDDGAVWDRLSGMLEATNPVVLETALAEFLKFRRGDPELLLDVRPILDHPSPPLRERAARLIGQIVERHGGTAILESAELQKEVVARARRDPSVEVRIAATEALGRFEGDEAAEILGDIAADDADQLVRYAAEKCIAERRQRARDGARTTGAVKRP